MLFRSRHALVGSRNMNYRSFVHDLELDVELSSETSMEALEARFIDDCADSLELTLADIRGYQPIAFLISILLSPLKRWL